MNTAINNITSEQTVTGRLWSGASEAEHVQEDAPARITEILLTAASSKRHQCILPIVAHFTRHQEQRWVTWITSEPVSKATLLQYNVNTHNLRLIHNVPSSEQAWMFWDALACGTSHTVIASPQGLSKEEEQEFAMAAAMGNAQGIMLRTR